MPPPMRIGRLSPRAFGRRAAAGAVLAGATLLGSFGGARAAGPAPAAADAEFGEELAFAVPRVAPEGSRWGGVGLPQPLSPADAARIRRIFADQAAGHLADADALLAKVEDRTLLGDILADRYLQPGAHPTAGQLSLWLKTYGDLSDAPAIHAALAKAAPGAALPPLPSAATLEPGAEAAPMPEEEDPASNAFARDAALDRAVHDLASAGNAQAALRRVGAARIPAIYGAALRADVARVLFTQGRDGQALAVAHDAASRSGGRIGAASYVAGLAAWRLGRKGEAASAFEAASRAPLIAASMRAGAAFWAARAHLALGDIGGYRPWMLRAAASRRTFYGLLAARRLGIAGWTPAVGQVGEETLGEADVEAVLVLPSGKRVFALLQVGQTGRAEAALRREWPRARGDLALCRSIMLVAQAADLPDLASQIASLLQEQDGRPRDAARFPAPPLRPAGGFAVDPALVYALTRLESNFDPAAVSDAGAHGLMQLMPVTAGFISGDSDRFTAAPRRLHNAAVNLALGQRYVDYLASNGNVGGDLIRLLASYNAGPNRITDWDSDAAHEGDPLLYIESIPNDETRGFVHRALTYLWIYAARLGLPAPSLDALAADVRPSYVQELALAGAPFTLH